MSSRLTDPDAEARARALEPQHSFIVQAPAGSGKTELLSQRFLRLLATVEAPEQVLAITFTRKAAAEMRRRVLAHLRRAAAAEPPGLTHELTSFRLARALLERDRERSWQLLVAPQRLRIVTIDSLNAALARQMPCLAGIAANPRVLDDPRQAYETAAERVLEALDEEGEVGRAVEQLLTHLDNQPERLIGMLADMLARRDHWLRHLAGRQASASLREWLEQGIRGRVEAELRELSEALPGEVKRELLQLAVAAAGRSGSGVLEPLLGLQSFPAADHGALAQWRALRHLVLTAGGRLRRRLDKSLGFPAGYADERQRMLGLLQRLGDLGGIEERLDRLARLPPAGYRDDQWLVLGALFTLLPVAAAELNVLFDQRGENDFVGVALAALTALGESEAPSDLGLGLDYRLQHILVDEFQDTSFLQWRLLEMLTAAWEPGDGRSLFCVGDPMQSIYRFRDAEVGLFLTARSVGLGQLRLQPLQLTSNFRSSVALVDWFNWTFGTLFPQQDDPVMGAVPYAPSRATSAPAEAVAAVTCHAFAAGDSKAEALRVVDILSRVRERDPAASCAVLVRSRSHLGEILAALRAFNIAYRAVEIDALANRPVVQDLLALTRALTHLGDRTAWLAVMRAPFVGLSLADLAVVADAGRGAVLLESCGDGEVLGQVSRDGRARLERLCTTMTAALAVRGREGLSRWVEGVWVALGGPATLPEAAALDDAEAYLELLAAMDAGGDVGDEAGFARRLERLFAAPDPDAGSALQVLTIHKAKGLEFDVVIVPGLQRVGRRDQGPLLRWLETTGAHGEQQLLLAPVSPRGGETDPLHLYLAELENQRNRLERYRLIYVAVTRARRELHLLAEVRPAETGESLGEPARESLLAMLWPALRGAFTSAFFDPAEWPVGDPQRARREPGPWRLPADWVAPRPPASVMTGPSEIAPAAAPPAVEYDWASETARRVGTLVHRFLQRMAVEGPGDWSPERLEQSRALLEDQLRAMGVPEIHLEAATQRSLEALWNTVSDPRGRWVLDRGWEDAHCEMALTGLVDGKLVSIKIDRCFRDGEGRRWIVDYKTSAHEGGDLEAFLDREVERYGAQMRVYASLVALRYPGEPVWAGLYFPLLRGWRAWRAA